jgi:hypothetical protein
VAFEEIERRVTGPLPFSSHSQNQQLSSMSLNKHHPSFAQSEPSTRDSSLPGDTADLIARPMSSTYNAQYRLKTLPPIHPQQQQRRNGSIPPPNKSDQFMENQRRITRLIKHIK